MLKSIVKNKYTAYAGAVLCTMLWGTAFPLIKLGYEKFDIADGDVGSKLLFAGERFLLAGLICLAFAAVVYRSGMLISKRQILPVLTLGFVQTFLQYLFSYIGVGFTSATNTSIITGTTSLISVLFAGLIFKSDKLTTLKIVGCVIGFCGIIFMNMASFSVEGVTLLGDFLVLLSAFGGAFGNIITKKVTERTSAISATAWQLCFGGICLLIVGLILGGSTDFSKLDGVIILIWLSFVSAVSFLLWTLLLRYHPVSRITPFTMLIPIFGTIWSGIILGEEIFNLQSLVALLLVTVGIAMTIKN